jgi:hypothetical protein
MKNPSLLRGGNCSSARSEHPDRGRVKSGPATTREPGAIVHDMKDMKEVKGIILFMISMPS